MNQGSNGGGSPEGTGSPRDDSSLDWRSLGIIPPEETENGVPQLDGFQIGKKLGEGTFGVVFKATQLEPVQRQVAIKILKPGLDDEEVLKRFKSEQQTLAEIDHPSIAQFISGGSTLTGRPYFVMVYVNGVPIDDYCQSKRQDILGRISLFVDVCKAIHHAHQEGVIHRDLKPDNILVVDEEAKPRPVLIDFGLAKPMSPKVERTHRTQYGKLLGTPMFMSPEQADPTTRQVNDLADVYSLGAVLYVLVAGQSPHEPDALDGLSGVDLAEFLRSTSLKPPSTHFILPQASATNAADERRTDIRTAFRIVKGDLDHVIHQAMNSNPQKRYVSALNLAEDLERFQSGEPVNASRPTLVQAFTKLVRRHKFASVIAASFLFTLLFAVASSSISARTSARSANKFRRLAAAYEAELLKNEFPDLATIPIEARRSAIDEWLTRARLVVDDQPEYVREANQGSGEESELIYAERMSQLVGNLELFLETDGFIDSAESWQQRFPTLDEITLQWEKLEADLKEFHPDWRVTRLPWLFPFRKHPVSGLWEFVDLRRGFLPHVNDQHRVLCSEDMGSVFVLLPGGVFEMGTVDGGGGRKTDEVRHTVGVGPFLISKFECTRSQWDQVGRALRIPRTDYQGPCVPVAGVCWFDCITYCDLTDSRLPTEAEWEYACRAGFDLPFHPPADPEVAKTILDPFDLDAAIQPVGWYRENSDKQLQHVGTKEPNRFFLYDMHGNATEWCLDSYDPDFYTKGNPLDEAELQAGEVWWNPLSPIENRFRPNGLDSEGIERAVIRSGGIDHPPEYCRTYDRYQELQDIDVRWFGFRVVIDGVIELGPSAIGGRSLSGISKRQTLE
ncbi:MAG: bifunctional serine/threonine-protein kinase/formylglycine-generating enzyme family protein [Planctomycetota bacterium]